MPSSTSRSRDSCSPAEVALVWTTRSHVPPHVSAAWSGRAKPAPRSAATPRRPGSTSTSVTSTPGIRARSRATQQPTMPAPTTATRSPSSGAASQSALTAVSTVPASTARAGGTPSGTSVTASAGTTYDVWCGWRQNTTRPRSSGRTAVDDADTQVAVLHRSGEVAVLKGGAHRGVLALGDVSVVHERLGAAADAGAECADQHLVGARFGQGHRPDLADSGGAQPECLGLSCQPDHLPFLD